MYYVRQKYCKNVNSSDMDIGLETSTRRLNFGLAIQLIMEYVLNQKQIPVCVCYKGKICILLYLPR